MEFLPAIAMMALIAKIVDFLRYAVHRDANGVTTQLVVWVAGIAGVLLAAQTNWADGIPIGDVPLSQLNLGSLIFAGMSVGSGASVFFSDLKKAIDNNNTAKIPTLLPSGPPGHRPDNPGIG